MANVVILYNRLEYFRAIWYNLWPFGMVCGHLVYFLHLGMFGPRKIWQPCCQALKAGWPDWANFRLLGDCLLWALFSPNFGLHFSW
jgi:hypothetical protein